jgi:hypothetical protein
MWMGCVNEDALLTVLQQGSVAYCPSMAEDASDPGTEEIRVHRAPIDVFEFAVAESVSIVPVLCYGENALYTRRIGINWGIWGSCMPRARELHIYYGRPERQDTPCKLSDYVYTSLHSLNVTGWDKPLVIVD